MEERTNHRRMKPTTSENVERIAVDETQVEKGVRVYVVEELLVKNNVPQFTLTANRIVRIITRPLTPSLNSFWKIKRPVLEERQSACVSQCNIFAKSPMK